MSGAVLIVKAGPDAGRVFTVPTGGSVQLGRGLNAGLRLTDLAVSRVHCDIAFDGTAAVLTNTSSHGTQVNGRSVGTANLEPGDLIDIGETQLQYFNRTPENVSTQMAPTAKPPRMLAGPITPSPDSAPLAPLAGVVLAQTAEVPALGARPRRRLAGWLAAGALAVGLVAVAVVPRVTSRPPSGGDPGQVRGDPAATTEPVPKVEPAPSCVVEPGTSRLFVLAIGVGQYRDPTLTLGVADRDPPALADAFRQQGKLFPHIEVKTLVNGEATRENVITELAKLKRQVVQKDLVVVALSGHGILDDQDYYFLPADYRKDSDPAITGVPWDVVRKKLTTLPCPVVLLLDTCHSGQVTRQTGARGVEERGLRRSPAESLVRATDHGLYVIAACMSREVARESTAWGHGALTLAALEVLTDRHLYHDPRKEPTPLPKVRERDGRRFVALKELDSYVTDRVNELTDGGQAVLSSPPGTLDPLAIPLAARP